MAPHRSWWSPVPQVWERCLTKWKINPHHKWGYRWELFLFLRPGVKSKALPKFLAHPLCWQNPSCRWDFAFSAGRCDLHLSKRIFPSGLPRSAPPCPSPAPGAAGRPGTVRSTRHRCCLIAPTVPRCGHRQLRELREGQTELSSSSSALLLPWQPAPGVPPLRMPLLAFHGFWLEQHKDDRVSPCHHLFPRPLSAEQLAEVSFSPLAGD